MFSIKYWLLVFILVLILFKFKKRLNISGILVVNSNDIFIFRCVIPLSHSQKCRKVPELDDDISNQLAFIFFCIALIHFSIKTLNDKTTLKYEDKKWTICQILVENINSSCNKICLLVTATQLGESNEALGLFVCRWHFAWYFNYLLGCIAYWLFISTYYIKHILMPFSAWPYFRSLNPTPYLNLTTTLLTINKKQIRSLLRQKSYFNSKNWTLK